MLLNLKSVANLTRVIRMSVILVGVTAFSGGTVRAATATFDPFAPKASSGPSATSSSSSAVVVPATTPPPQTNPNPGLASFSVSDAPTVTEGPGVVSTFKVTLNKAVTKTVSVHYSTLNGTATAGSDYVAKSGTLTFTPGQTSKTVTVSIINNAEPPTEPNEFFYLALSNSSGAQIARSVGTAIIKDPSPPAPISITANDAPRQNEDPFPQFSKFTVTLSKASTKQITVHYATSDGTAKSGHDYTSKSGTLTFDPGQTSKTVTIAILDPAHDPTGDQFIENYFLNLSSPTNAVIARAKAKAEIANQGGGH